MKLYCDRDALLGDCQLVAAAAATRDIKPILRNIKAVASRTGCTLMATDLELGVQLEIRSPDVREPGEAILPAARLTSILRESSDKHLTLEADSEKVTVTGESNEFEMPSEDPADFPDLPEFPEGKHHEIKAGVLKNMIRKTAFAAARESSRFAMNGVLWELDNDTAKLVATDSKRLALMSGPAKEVGGHSTAGGQHIVPTKAMALLERNLHDDDETIKIVLRPNDALFKTERAIVYTRLVEGRFPPYKDIVPKKANARIPIPVGSFLRAVRQAAVMIDDESKRVVFHFSSGKLKLGAQGATTGRSKVEMPLEYTGPDIEIAFDPSYLTDMLKVLNEDDPLTLDLIDGSKPALFRNRSDYQYLVMPLA